MKLQVNTKMKISKPVNEVFEAIADTSLMANYWFSSGSGRLEEGKTITLRYDEYDANVDIKVLNVEANKTIRFQWAGTEHVVTITLNELDAATTIIEVNEQGWQESDDNLRSLMVDNKEGWVYMLTCLKGYLEYGVKLRAALVK